MKNLMKIRNLLAAMLLVFSTQAISGQLDSLEESLLEAWYKTPELRDDIADTYWAFVAKQASELREQLPMPISDFVVIIEVIHIRGMTSYFIVIDPNYVDTIPEKSEIAVQMCSDPQSYLYLVTFNGVINYVHFKEGVPDAYATLQITAEDCSGT